jgi:hypothetical protein
MTTKIVQIGMVLVSFFLLGCVSKTQKILVLKPAEIETKGIKKVAVGKFELAYVNESYKEERIGVWETRRLKLTAKQKEAISQQVRARVINALGLTPYFSLVYTDEFTK